MWDQFFSLFNRNKPPSPLAQIEEILVTEIPRRVMIAKIKEPICCLRIWFQGTDSGPDGTPYGMLIKDAARTAYLKKHGMEAIGDLWQADNWTYEDRKIDVHLSHTELEGLYARWYHSLCEANDERQGLQPFREMVQRVSKRLNAKDWKKILPATDDFVVFPADGSHTFYDDRGDLDASILPAQRLKLIEKKILVQGPSES